MKDDIKHIINSTLEFLELGSDDAASLIFATGMAESGYRCLIQKGGGPALGFFQCEPATAIDVYNNYVAYRPKYKEKLEKLGFDIDNVKFCLVSSIAIQVALCRLHYRRVPKALPKAGNLEAQGKYWKKYYNSELGKGTVEHFVEANHG